MAANEACLDEQYPLWHPLCMVSFTEIICPHCKKPALRKSKEVRQAVRRGRVMFCSRKCADAAKKKLNVLVCAGCTQPFPRPYAGKPPKYCSAKCREAAQGQRRAGAVRRAKTYATYIASWKAGTESGLRGDFGLSVHIRRYLFEKFGSCCVRCGWSVRNPYSMKVPLEVEHLDGDWRNNQEGNLALLCPNCHALTSTYKILNRGHGRTTRLVTGPGLNPGER